MLLAWISECIASQPGVGLPDSVFFFFFFFFGGGGGGADTNHLPNIYVDQAHHSSGSCIFVQNVWDQRKRFLAKSDRSFSFIGPGMVLFEVTSLCKKIVISKISK